MGLLSSSSLLVLVAIVGLSLSSETQLRLCVSSQEELLKCQNFTDITCILGTDAIDCVKQINNSKADITTLDGGDIYLAGKCYNMTPIIAESSNKQTNETGYYAVAVAKKSSNIDINSLKGSKSCHTGVNKTAGWFIPMSILFQSKKDNQLGKAANFFSQSCVPGANSSSNLCKLCKPNCERNSKNDYYGYDGTAKCLEETAADVAFVKHTTFLKKNNRNNYELLCKNGTKAAIKDYMKCHLAKVPSHAVVAKFGTTQVKINEILGKLNETPPEKLFSDEYGKNKIFSSSTESLIPVYESYENYLGADYINALPNKTC